MAFALVLVGACGSSSQADEIQAIKARLDKLEAQQAARSPGASLAGTESGTRDRAKAEEEARRQAESLEAITAKLNQLEAEQAFMEKERDALEAQIRAETDEVKRKELEAKLAELDKTLAGGNGDERTRADRAKAATRIPGRDEEEDPLGGI